MTDRCVCAVEGSGVVYTRTRRNPVTIGEGLYLTGIGGEIAWH